MFDFRRITLFCLEKHPSKHKMTIFSKILRGMTPFPPWLRLWFPNYLLSSWELELGASESFDRMVPVTVLASQRHDGLAYLDPGHQALRLAERATHASLEPVGKKKTKTILYDANAFRFDWFRTVRWYAILAGHQIGPTARFVNWPPGDNFTPWPVYVRGWMGSWKLKGQNYRVLSNSTTNIL